jgi:hypothetical protein
MTPDKLVKGQSLLNEINLLQAEVNQFNNDYDTYISKENNEKFSYTINAYEHREDTLVFYCIIDKDLFKSLLDKQKQALEAKLNELNKQFNDL